MKKLIIWLTAIISIVGISFFLFKDVKELPITPPVVKKKTLFVDRITKIINTAILPNAKEVEKARGDDFISSIPFKDDFDFKVYELSGIKYAIGVCNKEVSPIKKFKIMHYDKEIFLQQYDDYTIKTKYKMENIDHFVALGDSDLVIAMNSNNDRNIYNAMENFKLGDVGINYFDDVIDRKVALTPIGYKDYIVVRTWVENRGSVEYIFLTEEDKKVILADSTVAPNLAGDIRVVIDGKMIKENETVLRMARERCGYIPYKIKDLANFNDIKKIQMTKYCSCMSNNYLSSVKIEEFIQDEEKIKKLIEVITKGMTNVGAGANDSICNTRLEFTRADGTRLNLPMVRMEMEDQVKAYIGNSKHLVSSECLSELEKYFPKIMLKKKTVSKDIMSELYLGMPRKLAEEFLFSQGIDYPWVTAITSYPSDVRWGDTSYDVENMGLTFTSKDKYETLYAIRINDPSIPTRKGLKVGDDKAIMERLYGTEYEILDNKYCPEQKRYEYQLDQKIFDVIIEDDKVKSWSMNKDIYKHKKENRPSYIGEWEVNSVIKSKSGITAKKLEEPQNNSGNTVFFTEESISMYDKNYSKLIYPSEGLTYKENTVSSTDFEKENGISLSSLGITSQQLMLVKIDYLYNETPMTIVVDSAKTDKVFVLMNGDCIELARIKY